MRSFLLFALAIIVLVVANMLVPRFKEWLLSESDIDDPTLIKDDGVPVWVVGNLERLLAFFIVWGQVGEAYVVLAAWLGAKLATSWQRLPLDTGDEERNRQIRAGTLIALIAGVISVTFGVVAGLLARSASGH